jgi:HlyD family secretion protein
LLYCSKLILCSQVTLPKRGKLSMSTIASEKCLKIMFPGIVALLLFLIAGCSSAPPDSGTVQGYVEGDFVYIAAPLPGKMATLFVQRGAQVTAGEPLFELEDVQEKAARDETKQRLDQLRAQVADAKKGKRPTEINAMTAQLNLARTALQFSEKELLRQEKLLADNIVSAQDVDRLRSQRDQDRQRVAQLEAELETARKGLRDDQIRAAEASMRAMEATLGRSEWDLAQRRQYAPVAGLVFDTLYRQGEWLAAGRPAVVLLPPQNIKVRVFVPQALLATIHRGDRAQVTVDGASAPYSGSVNFMSPQAEYTPPVIYSRESRQKLVYMIELTFAPSAAAQLHPGQPVTVKFGSGS